MLKKLFQDVIIDVKSFYTDVLIVCVPFFIILTAIFIPVFQNFSKLRRNPLFMLGLPLVAPLLFSMACIAGLYFLKNTASGESSLGFVFQEMKSNISVIIGTVFKKVVLTLLGLLFFLPGIYFFIRHYFVYPALVLEKNKDPFKRSMDLTKKHSLFIFFLFFSTVIFVILSMIFGLLTRYVYVSIVPTTGDTRLIVFLGGILFFLLLTPIIVMFDYEFYLHSKSNYSEIDNIKLKLIKP